MKRQFKNSGFYRILKTIVIIISVLSLLLASLEYNKKVPMLNYKQKYSCIENSSSASDICKRYFSVEKENNRRFQRDLKIGISLPLIFFGVETLISYLFMKKDKKII